MSFKIGDKVQFKGKPVLLGYVSDVYKGQLFLLEDFEVSIHQGNGVHLKVFASEIEHYNENS